MRGGETQNRYKTPDSRGVIYSKRLCRRQREKGCKKTKKAAKPRIVLFASFSDTEKKVGCGAKPHCCRLRVEKAKLIISRVKTNIRSARSRRFGIKKKITIKTRYILVFIVNVTFTITNFGGFLS